MSIKCIFGYHTWNGCKCNICGKSRDEQHDWNGCKCSKCGKIRDWHHNWGDENCQICGIEISTGELGRRWADNLGKKKDYHALAKYFCTWHETLPGENYSKSVDLWNAKRAPALIALREAGPDAIDAILSEMEAGEDDHNNELATLLAEIGDIRAVPYLKKLLDRDAFSSSFGNRKVEEFVSNHPQYHGEVENLECPICGKLRPVTETIQCGDKRFCKGYCWRKRGRVIEHGVQPDCPHYHEGVCKAGGSDTGLCSLQQGTYQISCHVYAIHPK